ncbi:MAG: Crp/Fnr family transcriptional regulator [Betaproteobacteria bacterium]|nr:Crp/Fnr family transcriptional regulator [Betaproteobacteria bacterium]
MRGGYLNLVESQVRPAASADARRRPDALLARSRVFTRLPLQVLGAIARHAHEVHTQRDSVIFRRGERCESIYVVGYGYVGLSLHGDPDRERIVELRGPGESFGEESLFGDPAFACDAKMLTDGMLVTVPRQAVIEVLDRQPALAQGILENLARRTCELEQNIESHSMRSALERVVSFLMYNLRAGEYGAQEFTLPVAKQVIASLLNLTKESFSRALRELTDSGLIEVRARSIRVLDPKGLEALCFGAHGCTHCYGCARGGLAPS